jgi:hypothetical protein
LKMINILFVFIFLCPRFYRPQVTLSVPDSYRDEGLPY